MSMISRRRFIKAVIYGGSFVLGYYLLSSRINLPAYEAGKKSKPFIDQILKTYGKLSENYPIGIVSTSASPQTTYEDCTFFDYDEWIKHIINERRVKIAITYSSEEIPKGKIEEKLNYYFSKIFEDKLHLELCEKDPSHLVPDYLIFSIYNSPSGSLNGIDKVDYRKAKEKGRYKLEFTEEDDTSLKIINLIAENMGMGLCMEKNCVRNYNYFDFLHENPENIVLGERCSSFLELLLNSNLIKGYPQFSLNVSQQFLDNYFRSALDHNVSLIKYFAEDTWNLVLDYSYVIDDSGNLRLYILIGIELVPISFGNYLHEMKIGEEKVAKK